MIALQSLRLLSLLNWGRVLMRQVVGDPWDLTGKGKGNIIRAAEHHLRENMKNVTQSQFKVIHEILRV